MFNKILNKRYELILTIALLTAVGLMLVIIKNITPEPKLKAQIPPVTTGPDFIIDIPSAVNSTTGRDTAYPGQNLDVLVFLKTGANQVKSLDFSLNYDDTRLGFQNETDLNTNIEINPNSGFNPQYFIRKVDTVNKKIVLALVSPVSNMNPVPVSSPTDILLATVKFKIKPDAPNGEIGFLPDVLSTIYNVQNQNILSCVGGYRITVVDAPPVPTDTPPVTQAGLSLSLNLPDIAVDTIQGNNLQFVLQELNSQPVAGSVNLQRNGNYFQTSSPLFFDVPQSNVYTLAVKSGITIRRVYSGITLIPGQTLDCSQNFNPDCGDLISQRDNKKLLSGDSDGFFTLSGSYNKIDSADLQVLSLYFNQQAGGSASAADFNLDNQVDIMDLEILGRNYFAAGD